LTTEFDFWVVDKVFDPQTMGNAFVRYKSSRVGIEIVIDRDQLLIVLGDQMEPREKWFGYSYVLEYFAPAEIAYLDVGQLFNEKRANHTSNADTWKEVIEYQLQRVSSMLRQYCEPILRGNFDMKKEIKEIEQKNVTEMLNRWKNLYHPPID
jgi:hypothetical protein